MNIQDFKLRAKDQLKERYWYILLVVLISMIISGASIPMIIGLLLMGPLSVGVSYILLDLVENPMGKDNYDLLFEGFKKSFVNSFIAILLMNLFIFLWSLLLIIPGIIKAFSYSMTRFIIAENPEIDPLTAISRSQELMRGHKMDLLMLYLSYIGWYLLGLITFGIAIIYITPYVEVAVTNFYIEIRGKRIVEITVEERDAEIVS